MSSPKILCIGSNSLKKEKTGKNLKLPAYRTQPLAPSSFVCSAAHSMKMPSSCLSFPAIFIENGHIHCPKLKSTWLARRWERLVPWLILSFWVGVGNVFDGKWLLYGSTPMCPWTCSSLQQHHSVSQGFIGAHQLKFKIELLIVNIFSLYLFLR